jgi:hypothetical protein
VSSVNRLRDQYGRPGIFFVFPDVSVRQRGVYCLCATMVNVMRYVGHVLVQNGFLTSSQQRWATQSIEATARGQRNRDRAVSSLRGHPL